MMNAEPGRNGRVVTFYSYKGGAGRSMALANVAWILASAGKRVLVIDWDLEAPGLHRYFRPFLIDPELSASEGLMDLVDRYASEAIRPPPEGQDLAPDWWWPLSDIRDYVLQVDLEGFARRRGLGPARFPAGAYIDLLPAGLQSEAYAVTVSTFSWQNFFERLGGGGFLDAVRERARADYDYVLIDSRTGVSDTAGFCTAQLPDTLVVCFTYNNQSIKGAAAAAASARRKQAELAEQRQRLQSDDTGKTDKSDGARQPGGVIANSPRPYRVLPVPMRVDDGETDRLALRQAFARDAFGALLDGNTRAGHGEPSAYWAAVEVPYQVFYAYEEVLAPFRHDAHDPKTALSAFVRLTRELTGGEVNDYRLPLAPELRQALLEAYAETPQTAAAQQATQAALRETEDQMLARHVESVLQALGDADRLRARSALGRLVRLGRDDEGGGQFPIRVALAEVPEDQREIVAQLAQRSVLNVATGPWAGHAGLQAGEQTVALASGKLLTLSPTLQGWLADDREFLLWRQQLRTYRADWLRSGDRSALLSGSPLAEARLWARRSPLGLNAAEQAYIDNSIDASAMALPPLASAAPTQPTDQAAQMVAAPARPPQQAVVDTPAPAIKGDGSSRSLVPWALAALLLGGAAALQWWSMASAPKAASQAPAPAAGTTEPVPMPVPVPAAPPAVPASR